MHLTDARLPVPRAVPVADDLPAVLLRLADSDSDALADRLHDGAMQALVAARYAADAVLRGADPALVRDAVQDALVTLRREVWLLRQRCASGLADALTDLARQRTAAGQPALELAVDAGTATGPGAAAAGLAYRLVQEVLREAAQPVHLTLSKAGDRVALDLDACPSDVEVWSLRARAVGADLVVGPARLRLLLPLSDRDDKAAL